MGWWFDPPEGDSPRTGKAHPGRNEFIPFALSLSKGVALQKRSSDCALAEAQSMAALEDIYLPDRPKRRTRATIDREKGNEVRESME
jgi:hypothetical protein